MVLRPEKWGGGGEGKPKKKKLITETQRKFRTTPARQMTG